MSTSNERADPRAGFCPKCGALNGADFHRCIRCGAAISAGAAGVDLARGHLDGRSLLGAKALLGATICVFALQFSAALRGIEHATLHYGALPMDTEAALAEPWRLLSSVFVHYGILHIVMNMLGLANFGRIAEPALGTSRFLIAYVTTGLLGSVASVAYAHFAGGGGETAGASGAVFGMMGVVLGWMLRRRDPRWKEWAVQAVFYSLLFGFAVNRSGVGIMINNTAHVAGLLSGIIFGVAYAGARPRSDLWANVAAAVGVFACVVSIILPHLSSLGRAG